MLNNITVIGRLTAKPELKKAGDKLVTTFSVAVERNFKNKEGNRDTDFFNVVAWNHVAEFVCNHFNKGNFIAINGAMYSRKYKGKDGTVKMLWEIDAKETFFCANKIDDNNTVADEDLPLPF